MPDALSESAPIAFYAEQWDMREQLHCAVSAAVLETLWTKEPVLFVSRSESEARLMRARVLGLVNRRIRMNQWFYAASSLKRTDPLCLRVWIEPLTLAEMTLKYAHFPADTLARYIQEAPVCELKLGRIDRRVFEVFPPAAIA